MKGNVAVSQMPSSSGSPAATSRTASPRSPATTVHSFSPRTPAVLPLSPHGGFEAYGSGPAKRPNAPRLLALLLLRQRGGSAARLPEREGTRDSHECPDKITGEPSDHPDNNSLGR